MVYGSIPNICGCDKLYPRLSTAKQLLRHILCAPYAHGSVKTFSSRQLQLALVDQSIKATAYPPRIMQFSASAFVSTLLSPKREEGWGGAREPGRQYTYPLSFHSRLLLYRQQGATSPTKPEENQARNGPDQLPGPLNHLHPRKV